MDKFLKILMKPVTWIASACVCLIFAIITWSIKKKRNGD